MSAEAIAIIIVLGWIVLYEYATCVKDKKRGEEEDGGVHTKGVEDRRGDSR